MSSVKKETRILTEHNSDGTHAKYINVQSDVVASRAFGTVYQNTTGKPLFVSVMGTSAAGNFRIQAYSDTNATPTTSVGFMDNDVSNYTCLTFIVLPTHYYKVTMTTASNILNSWIETY